MNNPVVIVALAISFFLTCVIIGLTAELWQRDRAQEHEYERGAPTVTSRMWEEIGEIIERTWKDA